jgi:hypothetical protein
MRKNMAKAAKPRKRSRSYEELHVGSEIKEWEFAEHISEREYEMAIYNCLRHYNYFYGHKDAKAWAKSWASKTGRKDFSSALNLVEDWRVSMTLGGLCRIMNNGAKLPKKKMYWIEDRIQDIIKVAEEKESQEKKKPKRKSPMEAMRESANDFIAEVEEMVDSYDPKRHKECMESCNVYERLKSVNIPTKVIGLIRAYYEQVYQEYDELLTKKDKQLLEAYSHVSVANQKKTRTFFKKILDDIDAYALGKKAVRKPRKRKKKSSEELVKDVKYQLECPDLKITSMLPERIIGANVVYLFNTKYRTR